MRGFTKQSSAMYLTPADIAADLYPEIAAAIGRQDASGALLPHIQRALGLVRSRLATRYDMATELAKSYTSGGTTDADPRNALLVSIAASIAIYFFYRTQEAMPALRRKHYEDALAELALLQDGKSILDGVPPAPAPDPTTPSPAEQIAYASNPKRPRLW